MAATWGRAEIQIDADGSLLPAQVRRIATTAGTQGGQQSSQSFLRSFDRGLTRGLTNAFQGFRNGLRRMSTEVGETDGRMQRFTRTVRRLSFQFGNTVPMLRFRLGLMSIGDAARNVFSGLPDAIRRTSEEFQKKQAVNDRELSFWKSLSHNTRQWTLIIGAVIASISELSVLSSAAGSGLFVLAGALSAAVVGAGLAVWAVAAFSQEVENLPPAVQAARRAASDLGSAFKEMQDALVIRAFQNTEDVFQSLRGTVRALIPAVERFGDIFNNTFRDFGESIAPGTEAFEDLYGFIEKSGPIFDRLVRVIGRLGAGLLSAFNNPAFQRSLDEFVGWIEIIFDRFDAFLRGPGFDEWLDHGRRVFGAFGELLDTTGRLLNNLVTDESVDQLTDFIDAIDRFLQTGGAGILEFAQELDVFGILAEALATIGEALEPLRGPMKDFADAINEIIMSGIDTLGPIIEDVATALAPFVQGIADFLKNDPDAVAGALTAIAGAFVVLKGVEGIQGAVGALGTFWTKMDDTVRKVPGWKAGLGGLAGAFAFTLPGVSDGEVSGQDVVTGFSGALITGASIGGPIGAAVAIIVTFITQGIADALNGGDGFWGQIFNSEHNQGLHDVVQGWGDMLTGWRDNDWIPFWENLNNAPVEAAKVVNANISAFLFGLQTNFLIVTGVIQTGWNGFWGMISVTVGTWLATIKFNLDNGLNSLGYVWNNFWSSFPGVIGSVWGQITSIIRLAVNTITGIINIMINKINSATTAIRNLSGGFISLPNIPNIPQMASGGVLGGPRYILAGEAGPEAIVPLDRNLNRVDPSVRWLSAIAQGKSTPGMASGGVVGGGLTINDGAIQIIDNTGDSRKVANDVVQRLVEYAAG